METLLPDADVQLEQLGKSSHPPLFALRCMRSAHARLCEGAVGCGQADPKALGVLLQLSDGMHVAMTRCERLVRTPCARLYRRPPGGDPLLPRPLPFMCLSSALASSTSVRDRLRLARRGGACGAARGAVRERPERLPLETYCLTLQADLLTLLSETDAASSRAGSTARHAAQDAADDAPPPASAPPPPPSAPQHTDQHPVFSADATLPVGLM